MGDPPNGGIWLWALRVALVCAVVAAWNLARRRPAYWPTTAFLTWVGFAHIVRGLLAAYVIGSGPPGGVPYQGVYRAWFHVEQAMFVSWPIGIAALALWTFRGIRPWFAAGAWVAVVATLAASYPEVRKAKLYSAYLAIDLASILVSIVATIPWWRRRIKAPQPPEIAALLILFAEIGAVLLGPYAAGQVFAFWPINQGLYAGLYAALFALEVAWSRRQ